MLSCAGYSDLRTSRALVSLEGHGHRASAHARMARRATCYLAHLVLY
jgi:hypothetical protein